MHRRVSFLVALLIGAPAGPALAAAPATEVMIERIVAKINQDIITLSELQDAVKEDTEKLRKRYRGEEFERRRRELELKGLNSLVERKLVLQRAKTLGVTVQDKAVEKAMGVVRSRNKLTPGMFRRYLQARNITLKTFRKRMRESLILRQVVGIEVNIRVAVSDAEIADYYKANLNDFRKGESRKVQQIFFPIQKGDPASRIQEQKKKAEAAYKEALKSPAGFSGLAKRLSEGPAARRGGDLGFIKRGEVFPEFEAALFRLAEGKVGEPVRTRAGFHVLRVAEIRSGKVTPLKQVEDKIRNTLFKEKRAKRRREWLAELKRAAFLEIHFDPATPANGNGRQDPLFRDVREQVTFELVKVELLGDTELFGRERLFWAYGSKRRSPRWKSGKAKVNSKRSLEGDAVGALEVMHREFVNPDPAANLYLFEHNYVLPNTYLGKISFADVIKRYSLNPEKKRLEFLTDSKKARFVFHAKVEKTRSIVADPKEIGR
ncbi:MAG: peptidyl-prolyl cis-trans isomerase [bacterium]